ncbi:cyclic nucleotide-binding domain-containing protein [Kaistia dalseonensis]|uniref:CRP-like cAMP-binding protein n=1 Tax=Kaistia dalseonensis TaxID=410840 RepID=A0ABU0H4H5_9HYPH|nr:cyclic nucleotide-binding domain-containing protein [Kaistia dalseonensis]MCX5494629.1 cyclic nucleotide-binding domain-containing protein [Kaistia dalseonensis]MDQ0437209.1 CRP-like cAMP-binding protein [Kaistia dalseonensis]
MFDVLETFGGWYDLPANISYILFAISFFLTNIFWLRIFVIVSLAFEIVYFAMSSSYLYTGMIWDVIIILINLYRLITLLNARRILGSASGGYLLKQSIGELDDENLVELMKLGEAFDLTPGALLTEQGKPVEFVYLVAAGHAVAEVAGVEVGRINPGEFVGEVSFLTGIPATATVRASEQLSVIALDSLKLSEACAADPKVSAAIHQVIGNALARKLVASNRQIVAEARPA